MAYLNWDPLAIERLYKILLYPKLNRPFDFGWRREVVHRANGNAIDIYYFAPENIKLRSKPEVNEYLKPKTRLKIHHFTFARKPLGLDNSKEICRNAYSTERAENNRGGNGINNVENQIVQLTIEEDNTHNVQSCSKSTGKIVESDKVVYLKQICV
ncbi:Methyl-CpG DNA binding,DNA-binding domain [Cinara cedri]|uniref:Methyl-CpG DNA binding,DNA-binding domain n=1 Tax=Cinara cedri TaxID=506608 RepID=A0A5E4NQU0_9HEMI|nr:Methyl-CpG DNA binding,DNA-binding domain [Cinara cedri]